MSDTAKVLNVVLVNPDNSEESVLGQIAIGDRSQLSLVAAPDVCLEFLTNVIDQLNAKEVISVKVPGEMKYAVASQEFERTSPEFLDGLQTYLRHYYSIDLRASTDFSDKPDEFEPLTV